MSKEVCFQNLNHYFQDNLKPFRAFVREGFLCMFGHAITYSVEKRMRACLKNGNGLSR